MEQLKTFFAGKPILKVLDIGTGNGDFIKLLIPIFPEGTRITGIDPSREALAEARSENTFQNVEFIPMEGENLSFEDQIFDVVCLSNAMHHLANPEKTLSEMKRVLKSGGWLVIAEIVSDELNQAQENQKMLHHFKSHVDRKSGITHHQTWTEAKLLEIIQSNGIQPLLNFPFNRMDEPVTDPEKLENWIKMFAGHLAQLEGQPEYVEKSILFEQFKDRLKLYGFQIARQIVVVGQVI